MHPVLAELDIKDAWPAQHFAVQCFVTAYYATFTIAHDHVIGHLALLAHVFWHMRFGQMHEWVT